MEPPTSTVREIPHQELFPEESANASNISVDVSSIREVPTK